MNASPLLGLVGSLFGCALIALQTPSARADVVSYNLSPLWNIMPEAPGYEWVSTNHTHRGLTFNPQTTHLLTTSRYPLTNGGVYILASDTGAFLGGLNTNGVFMEVNFPLNMIGAADDGAIYACNLTVNSTNAALNNDGPFRIYRWADEDAEPTVAYIGDPSNNDTNNNHRRFGDSFAVRGSGVNTEILAGTRAGRIVARFTTSDGVNFTHQIISAPELLGVSAMVTMAFGSGNTFWVKTEAGTHTNLALQQFSFDPDTGTATLLQNYTNSGALGGVLGFDVDRKLLGIIRGTSHELRLFKVTDIGLVQQDATVAFATNNSNGNFTGSVVFHDTRLFALESNNGILAFQIATNTLTPMNASITAEPGQTIVTWNSQAGFIYQMLHKAALNATEWSNIEETTPGTGSAISITNAISGDSGFYRLRVE